MAVSGTTKVSYLARLRQSLCRRLCGVAAPVPVPVPVPVPARAEPTLNPDSEPEAMKRLAARDLAIASVIDVGASDGRWSKGLMAQLPSARYLLIEAQPAHRASLESFCASHARTEFALVAAGDRTGEIHFDATDMFGGQASETPYPEHDIVVPVTPVDQEVARRGLPGPYLVKFDTHGYEVAILKGAEQTLRETVAIVMECYNFKVASDCRLFWEMCADLASRGFRCIDLYEVLRRPGDHALWQMDMVFVRSDHPEFQSTQYRTPATPSPAAGCSQT